MPPASDMTLSIRPRARDASAGAARAVRSPARLDLILDPWGADMVDIPGRRLPVAGARLQGQQADGLVTRFARGVVSLVAELPGHERQAARELDQWNTSHEEPEPLDGSPAARGLELERAAEEGHGMLRRSGAGARDQPDGGGPRSEEHT